MSDTSSFGYGQIQPGDGSTDLNAIAAIVRQMIATLDTMKLVKVIASHPGTGTPPSASTVDVQPLVSQIDANGNPVPHGTVFGLQCWRSQGGPWAIILNPSVGDIGYVICADRDSSGVAGNPGQPVTPPSRRRMNVADGLYIGGCLNAVPKGTLWLKHDGSFVLTDSFGNVLQSSSAGFSFTGNVKVNGTFEATQIQTDDQGLTVTGNISATGTITAGKGGADQVGLQTHTHTQGVDSHGDTEAPTAAPTAGT